MAAADLPVRLPESPPLRAHRQRPVAACSHSRVRPGVFARGIRGRRETDTWEPSPALPVLSALRESGQCQGRFDRREWSTGCRWTVCGRGRTRGHASALRPLLDQALCDLGHLPFAEPFKVSAQSGMILGQDGEKMSKSRGNVITPDEMVEAWGADALRAYEMFISDFEMSTSLEPNGLSGTFRWLRRAWEVILRPLPQEAFLHGRRRRTGTSPPLDPQDPAQGIERHRGFRSTP